MEAYLQEVVRVVGDAGVTLVRAVVTSTVDPALTASHEARRSDQAS